MQLNLPTAMLAILLLAFLSTKAQSDFETGKKFYDDKDYPSAVKSFLKAYKKDPKSAELLNYLGQAYYYNNQYNEAIEYFHKLEETDPSYWAWYIYLRAYAYESIGEYDKAIADYKLFKEKYSKTPSRVSFHHQADFRIDYVQKGQELRKQAPTMATPVLLAGNINTSSEEYSPQIDATGTKLYFTSQRKSRFSAGKGADNKWGRMFISPM